MKNPSVVRKCVFIGMFGAISALLMYVQLSVPFVPPFYKLDVCEIPALIGTFALGPVAGVLIELIKNLLHLVLQGTQTAFVGEFGNFLGGVAFVVPAGIIYKYNRTKKGAIIGLVAGLALMSIWACFGNAFLTLPAYAKAFGWPMEQLIAMGTAVNPNINSLLTFVLFAVVPFNVFKGIVTAFLTMLVYKRVSVALKLVDIEPEKTVPEQI